MTNTMTANTGIKNEADRSVKGRGHRASKGPCALLCVMFIL